MMKPRQRSRSALWRHRDFLLLWAGQSVSEMGSAVTLLALPLTAVVMLQATTFQVGVLTAATNAAFLVVALPAGAVVDRLAKRRLMMWCDLGRLLVIGSVPVAAALGLLTLGQLYVVALLAGLGTVFFDVAYQSYLPALVSNEQLIDGNGKLQTSAEVARLGGPGLGGGLVGLAGPAGAMTADAVSYAVSVVSLLLIRAREPAAGRGAPEPAGATAPGPATDGQPSRDGQHSADGRAAGDRRAARGRLRADLTAGLSFVFREPILRKIVACTGTSNLFNAAAMALEIIFLVRVLHVRPAVTGLVVALAALGGIAGGAASGWLARRIGSARIIWVSVLGFGAVSLLIPLAAPGWGVLLFIAGWASFSFAGVVYNVAQVSYRQAVCPPYLLGRMNAAVRWIVWGTLPLGGLLGGALGAAIGVRPTLWIAVTGSWAAGLWVFFSPLRRMRDVPPPGSNLAEQSAGRRRGALRGRPAGRAQPAGPGPAPAPEG